MVSYYADIDKYCTYEREEQEDTADSWYEYCHNTFKAIYKEPGRYYEDYLESELELEAGQEVFVVWYEYSTGNSFGHGYYNRVAVAEIFDNYSEAEELKTKIEDFSKTKSETYSINYQTNSGRKISVHAAWYGYFENLEEVHIEQTRILI